MPAKKGAASWGVEGRHFVCRRLDLELAGMLLDCLLIS